MAIDKGTATATVTERTWRVGIETAADTDPAFSMHRENVLVFEDGQSVKQTLPDVTRQLADVTSETVEVDGVTISATQIVAALAAFADRWAVEDASP